MEGSSNSNSTISSLNYEWPKVRKRARSINFTTNECEIIVNLVTKYQQIIENRRSDAATWRAKEAAWDKIRHEFNRIVGNEIRTTQSIRSKYETMKKNAKKERLSSGDVRQTMPISIREKIRLLQESTYDQVVNENSIDLVANDNVFITDIKKETDTAADSSGVDAGAWSNMESDGMQSPEYDEEEEEDTNKASVSERFLDSEELMKKKEHEMKMNIFRLKAENQIKEAQEHDLKIQILKLDLELKKRQLKLLELKDFSDKCNYGWKFDSRTAHESSDSSDDDINDDSDDENVKMPMPYGRDEGENVQSTDPYIKGCCGCCYYICCCRCCACDSSCCDECNEPHVITTSSSNPINQQPISDQGYYWCDASQGIPAQAIKAGVDKDGGDIYVGRATHNGEIQPAKVLPNQGCAYVAWGGEEHRKDDYEILCKGQCIVIWQEAQGGAVPPGAIPVGITSENERLYVGRVFHEGTHTPGKVHPSHGVCYIPFDGQEISYPTYEVLILQ